MVKDFDARFLLPRMLLFPFWPPQWLPGSRHVHLDCTSWYQSAQYGLASIFTKLDAFKNNKPRFYLSFPEDFGMNNGKFRTFSRVFGFRNNARGSLFEKLYNGYNQGCRVRSTEAATETPKPRIRTRTRS